jgi:alkanesulfonate monooxygenase SsuD/methylene tetrahydromethanopterin reductase-like flavin-dependent oxidoreductase (luciferase family)
MDIGVGLPMKALSGDELTTFAHKVEDAGFASISLGQRLTFESNDPMIALTYVAAITNRVRLMTSVLCLPFHKEGVTAQQAATLDRLSNGRFSFGVGLGGRESDFAVAPEQWGHRGERFEQQLLAMKRMWRGEPAFEGTDRVGPTPFTPGGPEIIIGGFAPKALERAGRLADGIRSFSFSTDIGLHTQRYAITLDAWRNAGRSGKPRLVTATHFALGPGARERYEAHVAGYYGYSPAIMQEAMSGDAPTSGEAIRSTIRRFAEAGVDELVFTATTGDTMDSLDRLAEVVGGLQGQVRAVDESA